MGAKASNGVRSRHSKAEAKSLKRKRDDEDLERLQQAIADLVGHGSDHVRYRIPRI